MSTPQYDVFIAGSGLVACTFARTILDARPTTKIYMAEIGSQDNPVIGGHHKNAIKYQKDTDSFSHVIRSALVSFSIPPGETYMSTLGSDAWRHNNTKITASGESVPNDKVLIYQGRNPNQDPSFNLRSSAATRTVGGMSTHWTANCPRPEETEERAIGQKYVSTGDFDALFETAGNYLNVNTNQYDKAIRHTIVRKALERNLPAARKQTLANLDLAVERRRLPENPDYVTWSSASTILDKHIPVVNESRSDSNFGLHTEKRVTRLIGDATKVTGVVVRNLNGGTNADITITARAYVIACGAVCTPQILWNSAVPVTDDPATTAWNNLIRPPALGCYLSEHSIAFCQIVMSRKIVDTITAKNLDGTFDNITQAQYDKIMVHQKKHSKDPIPIPFNDPEPQLALRYTPDYPWHAQIHRDSFSFGDIGPKIDSRIVVDLRWFGKSDIIEKNRVVFGLGGVKDIYAMPQPTFIVERTIRDGERDKRMMKEMCEVASILGGYVPGSNPGFLEPGIALHITGTTRMGTPDAAGKTPDSVVNSNSKVHGIDNLWLGGCNVIPDSTACNPTRTAVAYAIRSARDIVATLPEIIHA